jgi:mono/diheme cytochrome c family protein
MPGEGMTAKSLERAAIVVTVVGVVIAVAWPFIHEGRRARRRSAADRRVITITGLAATGVWTAAEVRAGDYFAKEFAAAQPVLQPGQTVLFRFKSADVVHTFYSPELGIGPVEVYPGHVAEVEITPTEPGAYDYYCTTVCGAPHFRMRGQIIVAPAEPSFDDPGEYWLAEEPEDASLVERGQWLFRRHACFSCHGRDGHGGVRNPNYAKETVPALDVLAEQAYLYHPEDIETIVALLERRTPLEDLWDNPPVPLFHAVLGKYQAVRDIIRKGSPAGKLDPEGREPPLSMPTWGQQLTDDDIDALIAYLLTLEPLAYSPQFGG